MSKVTYENKTKTITPAAPDFEVWQNEDANEVKAVINENDDARELISKSGLLTVNVKLDLISGYFVNSAQSPITTTIPIDLTGAIQGGDAAVWYKGPVIDDSTITGATTLLRQGTNVANELCCVFIMYEARSNGILVNIMSGESVVPPVTAPAKMTINSITTDAGGAPAKMTINSIT